MDRALEAARQHFRHERQRGRDEALHVGGAAAVEPAVALGSVKGSLDQGWPVDRHDVGVARQHDRRRRRRARGGEEIGLGAPSSMVSRARRCRARRDSPRTKSISARLDFARGGVEGDEARQHLDGQLSALGRHARGAVAGAHVCRLRRRARIADDGEELAPRRAGRCGRRRACGWSPCVTPGLCTPRVVMHWCAASITTATPRGCSTSLIVLAICAVSFSWICRRRA